MDGRIGAASGGTSVDRGNKATLLRTVPGGALKSSAEDSSARALGRAVARRELSGAGAYWQAGGAGRVDGAPSSAASSLEAFSF